LSPKQWAEKTGAIGIISKSGRYGGTYAHRDIAFEFGSWISPTFKLYLITEYQRLKEIEYRVLLITQESINSINLTIITLFKSLEISIFKA